MYFPEFSRTEDSRHSVSVCESRAVRFIIAGAVLTSIGVPCWKIVAETSSSLQFWCLRTGVSPICNAHYICEILFSVRLVRLARLVRLVRLLRAGVATWCLVELYTSVRGEDVDGDGCQEVDSFAGQGVGGEDCSTNKDRWRHSSSGDHC